MKTKTKTKVSAKASTAYGAPPPPPNAAAVDKILSYIVNREPGWSMPTAKVFGKFYTHPLRVAVYFPEKPAKAAFGYKVLGSTLAPERVFFLPWKCPVPLPQDRFNPSKVRLSANHNDWDDLALDAAQRAKIRVIYKDPYCPQLTNEWDIFMGYASRQASTGAARNTRGRRNPSPSALIDHYIFVRPEVQLVDAPTPSPNPKAIFELRFSQAAGRHFYLCYTGGVPKHDLVVRLEDAIL